MQPGIEKSPQQKQDCCFAVSCQHESQHTGFQFPSRLISQTPRRKIFKLPIIVLSELIFPLVLAVQCSLNSYKNICIAFKNVLFFLLNADDSLKGLPLEVSYDKKDKDKIYRQ